MKRPLVCKEADGSWSARLDHGTWEDETPFDSWDLALEHALWLYETNARRAHRPA